jgi:hypothetical protein
MFSILAPALRVNLFVTKYMRNVILGVSATVQKKCIHERGLCV